jgi:hypothetical protein
VREAIPLATSLTLHAAVIAIGLLTARAIQVAKAPEPVETQSAAAVTDFQETDAPKAPQGMTLAGEDDPTRPPAQDQVVEVTTTGWAKTLGPNALPTPQSEDAGPSADAFIGISATSNSKRFGPGQGPGGTGGGGPLMPFGPPGGKSGGSTVFPPPPSRVRTVVYVCDASGSMIQTFSSLKAELTKAVTTLKGIQGFNIVFFQDEKAASMDPGGGLVLATPENKKKAFTFLEDASTSGTTNPVPGLELAFKAKPQLIYLLTDADFPDNAAVLATIRRLNAGKQTKVNTIAFTSGHSSDELSAGFIDLMKTIAQENGGTFKLVKENEL